jgi:hypothetical protein
VTGPGLSRRSVLRCPQDGRRVTCPSSSLLDGLGCGYEEDGRDTGTRRPAAVPVNGSVIRTRRDRLRWGRQPGIAVGLPIPGMTSPARFRTNLIDATSPGSRASTRSAELLRSQMCTAPSVQEADRPTGRRRAGAPPTRRRARGPTARSGPGRRVSTRTHAVAAINTSRVST